ncbi:hypothetical protein B0H14DRAFT_3591688 [Mycena olivaceomarginata]|nr:hypothetical protein B0H14DRAFT_3591688 [Mycena olivaceomarginata]
MATTASFCGLIRPHPAGSTAHKSSPWGRGGVKSCLIYQQPHCSVGRDLQAPFSSPELANALVAPAPGFRFATSPWCFLLLGGKPQKWNFPFNSVHILHNLMIPHAHMFSAAFANPPHAISAKNAAITYWLSIKPRRPLAHCALFLQLATPLASSYNISIGPDIPPTSWDRSRSQQRFHNASRHTQDQVWVMLPLAHLLYRSSCPSCSPTHPPGSPIGLHRAAYTATQIPRCPGPTAACLVSERMPIGTPPVELLPGESISNVYPISWHDQPKCRDPHTLLPRLPKVAPTCPCTRSRFTLRTLDPLLSLGSLIVAPPLTSYAAALSASALTSAQPPMYGETSEMRCDGDRSPSAEPGVHRVHKCACPRSMPESTRFSIRAQ